MKVLWNIVMCYYFLFFSVSCSSIFICVHLDDVLDESRDSLIHTVLLYYCILLIFQNILSHCTTLSVVSFTVPFIEEVPQHKHKLLPS